MTKNYADIYNSANDAISLEQRFYLKEETTRGSIIAPAGTDFFFTLPGGQIGFEQPFESSPQRSGRHHNNIIKKKKITNWNFSSYFNIDTTLGAAGVAEIDPAMRVLWKSLLGTETTPSGPVYKPTSAPNTTFTLIETGDKWARQSPGCFVQGGNIQMPGDGESMVEWTGMGKTTYFIGMGKTTVDNDAGNDITLQSDEAQRFVPGGLVMLIEADGTTRSADTPDGSPRTITAVNTATDVITVDGAALADADGSAADIYLVYYEPETPSAIDDPVTGLTGSVSIVGLADQCIRTLNLNIQNNHEVVDYCYGEDGLGGTLFVPGDRVTGELSISMNMNHSIAAFFNNRTRFNSENITAILGDSAARHFKLELPRSIFQVPGFSVPDTGSIPVEFSGTAYQTTLDAADEITASFL